MAKLSAHGRELARAFDPRRGKLVAYMEDGVTLCRSVGGGWKILARKKPDVSARGVGCPQAQGHRQLSGLGASLPVAAKRARNRELVDGSRALRDAERSHGRSGRARPGRFAVVASGPGAGMTLKQAKAAAREVGCSLRSTAVR